MKNILRLLLLAALVCLLVGCSDPPAEAARDEQPTLEYQAAPEEPLIPEPELEPVPSDTDYLRSRFFTDVMPPLTPEQEAMVDLPVSEEILSFFRRSHGHGIRVGFVSHQTFSAFVAEHGLTYGELWRFLGSTSVLEEHLLPPSRLPHQGVLSMNITPWHNESLYELYNIMPHLKSINFITIHLESGVDNDFLYIIGEMTWLIELQITSAVIERIPESFGQLRNLRRLDVSAVSQVADDAFIGLESLERLTLRMGGFMAHMHHIPSDSPMPFPSSILTLGSLEELNLRDSHLVELPGGIGGLTNLRVLDLRGNPLSVIPDEITALTNLERLYLDAFAQIGNFRDHRMAEDELLADALPESIGDLTNLTSLTIANFPITQLPESIGDLESLRRLHLGNLPLETLPDSFANLQNLTEVYISGVTPEESERLVELVTERLGRDIARIYTWYS